MQFEILPENRFGSSSLLSLVVCLLASGSCAGGMAARSLGPATARALDPGTDEATLQRVQRAASGQEIEERFSDYVRKHPNMEYHDLVDVLGVRSPSDSPLPFDPTRAAYFKEIDKKLMLTSEQRAQFQRNGLLVVPGASESSMGSAYLEIFRLDLPVLITSDSILHAWHRSFDSILATLEANIFGRELEKVLDETRRTLAAKAETLTDPGLRESLEDVDLYLTVARRLLGGPDNRRWDRELADPSAIRSSLGHDDQAAALVKAVHGLEMGKELALFGENRVVDFSQFKPRGHYADDRQLERYFRTMMWLGRIDLGFKLTSERGLRASALMSLLLTQAGQMERLSALDRTLQFLVGVSDNPGPRQLAQVLASSGLADPRSLADPNRLAALKEAMAKAGFSGQLIRSQVLSGGAPLPDTFQVFGQRFVLDSYVLSKLVYSSIMYHGESVKRMMPTGLDVMAALGNNEAVPLLEPQIEEWGYATNLAAARALVETQAPETWDISAYNLWLSVLTKLDDLPKENLPAVMRGQAWRRKQLQTQLASWAELRHDTILYAKQSYSGFLCEYPAGYVEPYPQLFARLALMSEQVGRWIAATGWSDEDFSKGISDFLQDFSRVVTRLEGLANRELAGQTFDRDEIKFIKETIQVTYESAGCTSVPVYTGWYKDLFYDKQAGKWDALVADVHTNPKGGAVLEVATGSVDLLVAAIDNGADRMAYVGPIYSYYEFSSHDRLTDGQWQEKTRTHSLPPRPAWLQPLLAPAPPGR